VIALYCTTYLYNGKAERLCEDGYKPHGLVAHISQQTDAGMPWWLYALIGGGVLCMLIGMGLIFRGYRRGAIPRSISGESMLSLLFVGLTFSAVMALACFIQGFMSNDPHLIHKSFAAGFLNTGGFGGFLSLYIKYEKRLESKKVVASK
jgi:hypothetical protein